MNNFPLQVDSLLFHLNPELWLQLRLEKIMFKRQQSLPCSPIMNLIISVAKNKILNIVTYFQKHGLKSKAQ